MNTSNILDLDFIVYKTTCLINNKIYVGSDTKNKKWYFGSGLLISSAIKKYGKQNFIKEIIDTAVSLEELDEKEIYWIKKLDACNPKIGYNISPGGVWKRRLFNSDSKNKMSLSGKNYQKLKRQKRIETILKSNIDFSDRSWKNELAFILKILPDNAEAWLRKHMPETYNICCKYTSSETQKNIQNQKLKEKIREIKNLDIDFSKSDWYLILSKYLNIKNPKNVIIWMKKRVPELYKICNTECINKVDNLKKNAKIKQRTRINLILNSNINFQSSNWTIELGKLLNIDPGSVQTWVRKNMNDFYETCYKDNRGKHNWQNKKNK